jgi:hypothetical protein
MIKLLATLALLCLLCIHSVSIRFAQELFVIMYSYIHLCCYHVHIYMLLLVITLDIPTIHTLLNMYERYTMFT